MLRLVLVRLVAGLLIASLVTACAAAGARSGVRASSPRNAPAQASASSSPEPEGDNAEGGEDAEGGGGPGAGADPGSPPVLTLEGYAAIIEDSMRQEVRSVYDGLYSDGWVEAVPPNRLKFVYVFADPVDVEATVATLEQFTGVLESVGALVEKEVQVQVGIARPEFTWIYRNPDGTAVWSWTYRG